MASEKPDPAPSTLPTEDETHTDAAPDVQLPIMPLIPASLLQAIAPAAPAIESNAATAAIAPQGARATKAPLSTLLAPFLSGTEMGEEKQGDAADFANDLLAALGSAHAMARVSTPTDPMAMTDAAAQVADATPVLDFTGDAWLDQLARDITATASTDGKLTFRIVPPSLGKLDINIETRDAGIAVHMKTETREAQAILSSAHPRLESALGAQGIRVTETSVASNGQDGNLPRPQFIPQKPAIEAVIVSEHEADAPTTGRDAGRFA